MPAERPALILAISKMAGVITGPVDLATTYTNEFAIAANKLEGFPGLRRRGPCQGLPSPEQRDVRESW